MILIKKYQKDKMKITRRNSSLEVQKRAYLGDRSLSLDDLNRIGQLSKADTANLPSLELRKNKTTTFTKWLKSFSTGSLTKKGLKKMTHILSKDQTVVKTSAGELIVVWEEMFE